MTNIVASQGRLPIGHLPPSLIAGASYFSSPFPPANKDIRRPFEACDNLSFSLNDEVDV
jgi:hypothetical protein